ncbi:MAG TPA: class I SAM-dependent methyltransferase [Phototrophicaceae bacterium]|nr:class I SAM-dependent methyltransferase [Phototrophicaceae bacterium]
MDERVTIQQQYYTETAHHYDEEHVHQKDEHYFAISLLAGVIPFFEINSILDVGAGTGRALLYLKERYPQVRVTGIEPVAALRAQGYAKGLSQEELIDGNANAINFPNESFDLVTEFAVLHHVPEPSRMIAEMLRVAKIGIFISDGNRFGQGSPLGRFSKQLLGALGLWKTANFIKTRGKGYSISEGDGLFYSYSVFDNYAQIRAACKAVYIINTQDAGINPYRSAPHVALLAIK